MALKWYVVHTYSGFENRVKLSLQERIATASMQPFFSDILIPEEDIVELVSGEKKTSKRKFFPGYILVRMEMNDNTWHLVKDCPRIMGFVGGTPETPAPITQVEADRILNRLNQTEADPRPKTLFEPGEELLVIDGPFTDFKGLVEKVDYEKSKLHLTVNVFNRPTQVELEFSKVEKLD